MNKIWLLLMLIVSLALLPACGAFEGSGSEGAANYDQIKQMVKDIMQTEDGKKAIQKTIENDEMKKQLIINSEDVKKTIEDTLLSEKGISTFQKMVEDPKFSSELAKAMQKENEKVTKDLMKDPEYQKMLIEVMKDPEFEKNMLELMKSSAYRQQVMTVLKESLQSPLFQEDLLKLLAKVQEEASKPKKEEGKKDSSGEEGGGE